MKTSTPSDAEAAERLEGDKPIADNTPAAMFIQNLIGTKPKKEEEKPKDEGDLKVVEGDEGKPATPPPAKPKKKAATPPPAVIDEEKLGASIGRSLAEHSASREKKQEDAPEAPKLEKGEARRIAALERMEVLNPEQYKGIATRWKENKSKLRTYAAEWEAANPGEKFDENADEHTDFIEALEAQVAYQDDDYTEALADIRAEQKFEAKRSELDDRVSRVERSERAREEAPKIAQAGAKAGNEFWKEMGDEFKEVVTDKGDLNPDALKAIQEDDPIKHEIVIAAAEAAENVAMVVYRLANNLDTFNPENPTHAGISKFAIEQEAAMLKRPPDERKDDAGRDFVTKAQHQKLSKEERQRHWTFSPEDISFMAVRTISKQAKENLKVEDAKFQRRAKAKGLLKDDELHSGATNKAASIKGDESEDDDGDGEGNESLKPISPTSSSSPKLAAGKGAAGDGHKTGLDRFTSRLLGA